VTHKLRTHRSWALQEHFQQPAVHFDAASDLDLAFLDVEHGIRGFAL
jgi:hypothetical protein